MASAAAMTGQEAARYTRVAVGLHWLIAALIVANLAIGLFHEDFDRSVRGALMAFHKSTGITILLLSLARLAWRLTHRPPAYDAAMKPWEATLARLTHILFYVLLIVLPLSGWLISSTGKKPVGLWYGLFDIARLPASPATHELWEESHQLLGYAMLVLLVLHVAGALKHHFEGHRQMFRRMTLFGR
ncbi:MAG: cytochrome b [Allosphingosinicella sp.]